jgi:hypothetical protein
MLTFWVELKIVPLGTVIKLINALERWERAAHCGDCDILYMYCIFVLAIDHVCSSMIYIMLLLRAEGDGHGAPRGKALFLRLRWQY